jgi:acyl-CoA oxidase
LSRRRELIGLIENDPVFRKWDIFFQSRSERYRRACEKTEKLIELLKKHNIHDKIELMHINQAIDDMLPIGLHNTMFVPAIENLTSPQQANIWIPAAKSYAIIGNTILIGNVDCGNGNCSNGSS